jgi:hypothetical protein
MSQRIVYSRPGGSLVVLIPAPESGLTIEQVAQQDVPLGYTYAILEDSAFPPTADYRDSWVLDTSDQDNPVVVEDEAKKAEIDKARALDALEDWFREVTEPGFATADGWRLGLTTNDVILLTGHYVLAKESAALGGPIPPIMDMGGVPHEIEEIEELTAIMLAYGQRRAEISAEYAAKKAAILGE